MVATGCCGVVPGFASLPVVVDTKTDEAMLPSMPSQSLSRKLSSGVSAFPSAVQSSRKKSGEDAVSTTWRLLPTVVGVIATVDHVGLINAGDARSTSPWER